MSKRVGLILLAAVMVCQAQYWSGHPDNRDIFADYMDFGVDGAPGILKGQHINFIVSGYSTMAPCIDELTYLLAQHEIATGTSGLYTVVDAIITGASLLDYVGCPTTYTEGANYQTVVGKMVAGQTNVLVADQSPSGLCSPVCGDKTTDNITDLNDTMADRYAIYMDTISSRYLRDGFDKVYFNSHLYYSGRPQGMAFQWYGMYKFFRDHPKANVFPGPYTCGIAQGFYPTGYQDTNHPTGDGPIAKIIGLGWYVTLAGEDALESVMKPYLDTISSYNLGTFPARDYIATKTVQSKSVQSSDIPVSIKSGVISIKTDIGHTLQVVNLNGKMVYSISGRGAVDYAIPHLERGVYMMRVLSGEKNYTGKVALF